MAEDRYAPRGRILTGAVWAAAVLVAILLIVVGYLFFQFESKRSGSLVQREIDEAQKFEKRNVSDPLSNIVQGELYYRQGKAEAAEREFRIALEKDPASPRAHINLGTVLAQQREYNEAAEQFREVIRLRKEGQFAKVDIYLAEARYQMGLIRTQQGRCADATVEFKEALLITPMDADAHYALGHCYLTLKNYNEAVVAFTQATTFDPTFAQALYETGQAYERLGQRDKAIQAYNRAVVSDPSLTQAENALQRLGEKSPRSEEGAK